MKLSELRGAAYNPRTITDKEREQLRSSYETFGDLSGIVFNVATKRLISGHQRVRTLKESKVTTKIRKTKAKDKLGTVAVGFVEATYEDGNVIQIPYREVKWTDQKAEKAANIAANAAGGTFDQEKLGKLVAELEKDKKFDIELTGLKMHELQGLRSINRQRGLADSDTKTEAEENEFKSIDVDSVEFEHKCPRCDYEFNT